MQHPSRFDIIDPSRPEWNERGQRADVVARYQRQGNILALAGTDNVVVSGNGPSALKMEWGDEWSPEQAPFPMGDFPTGGLLVQAANLEPVVAPKAGQPYILVARDDVGLCRGGETLQWRELPGGIRVWEFVAADGITLIDHDGTELALPVMFGRIGSPLSVRQINRVPGLSIDNAPAYRDHAPDVFAGHPSVRQQSPLVTLNGNRIEAEWVGMRLKMAGAGRPGRYEVSGVAGGAQWRTRFWVVDFDPQPKWGDTLQFYLPFPASWSVDGMEGRPGTHAHSFTAPLPHDGAQRIIVEGTCLEGHRYRWSARGCRPGIELRDAGDELVDNRAFTVEQACGSLTLNVSGPVGAEVRLSDNNAERTILIPDSGVRKIDCGRALHGALQRAGSGYAQLAVKLMTPRPDGLAPVVDRFRVMDARFPPSTATNPRLEGSARNDLRLAVDLPEFQEQLADVGLTLIRLSTASPVPAMPADWERHTNTYKTCSPVNVPNGDYAIVLNGRLGDGPNAGDPVRMGAVLWEYRGGPPMLNNSADLKTLLQIQNNAGLVLSAPRRTFESVRALLEQLAEAANLLRGPHRLTLLEGTDMPHAAERLAWWTLRARVDGDARTWRESDIGRFTLATLDNALLELGWHPKWQRYCSLTLMLPHWPVEGYGAWRPAAKETATAVAAFAPHLERPLATLRSRHVATSLAERAVWPQNTPTLPAAGADVQPAEAGTLDHLVGKLELELHLNAFFDAAWGALPHLSEIRRRAEVAGSPGSADRWIARLVALVAARQSSPTPRRGEPPPARPISAWRGVASAFQRVEGDPELRARMRYFEAALLTNLRLF